MIHVRHKSTMPEQLAKKHPNAPIFDLTSKGEAPYVRFSPFYAHGGIPIPLSSGAVAESVEGIWQGLKVFENTGIDQSKFLVTNMVGLKRTVRKFGTCLGHQAGLQSSELLGYLEARRAIYLPAYRWVLENKLTAELSILREAAQKSDIVLLDYETNGDIDDPSKPLSHAWLVKYYLDNQWPI